MNNIEQICWIDFKGLNSKYLPSNYDLLVKFTKGKYLGGDCSIETMEDKCQTI